MQHYLHSAIISYWYCTQLVTYMVLLTGSGYQWDDVAVARCDCFGPFIKNIVKEWVTPLKLEMLMPAKFCTFSNIFMIYDLNAQFIGCHYIIISCLRWTWCHISGLIYSLIVAKHCKIQRFMRKSENQN